jgi:hypothetical protein
MHHQTATVKRKKKSTLWGLAAILFCINVIVFYLLFIRPAATATEKPQQPNRAADGISKPKSTLVTGKH